MSQCLFACCLFVFKDDGTQQRDMLKCLVPEKPVASVGACPICSFCSGVFQQFVSALCDESGGGYGLGAACADQVEEKFVEIPVCTV